MKKIDSKDALKWLKEMNKGMDTLSKQQKHGLLKAKLMRVKKQIDIIIEDMENEEV